MKVSVVIVSYNVAGHLRRCLDSVLSVGDELGGGEIVVVDNASSDDSVAVVAAEAPRVTLLALDRNVGFGAAVNHGASRCASEALLLLNPDAELRPGVVQHLARELDADHRLGAVAPRQVDGAERFQLSVGPQPGLWTELGRKVVQKALDRGGAWSARLVDRALAGPRDVAWAAASCLLVRRRAFDAVGGFDETFFLYFEDIDLCLRLGAAGLATRYDPRVTMVHHRGVSAKTDRGLAARAYRASQRTFWRKHHGGLRSLLVEAYLRVRPGEGD